LPTSSRDRAWDGVRRRTAVAVAVEGVTAGMAGL
jgi:hypothetical protein